ncbi:MULTISPECIES: hypothetical protein [unclassified Prochlorococcus]|uniref:hypothetical protein n=1 Tax=unclassified Prochlorococcus TaxID=2627481 RepID=UPI0005338083|nr:MULTISPECIES: hypothetical protein [unclassified Prochlorococcus]KGG17509.1 hypothetical protein EV07_0949 [Prochlorococcus sp. MIT 0603]
MKFKFLDLAYKKVWVPLFGRVLFKLVYFIEREKPTQLPTYRIEDKFDEDS